MGDTKGAAAPKAKAAETPAEANPAGLLQLMLSDAGAQQLIGEIVQRALNDRREAERDQLSVMIAGHDGFKTSVSEIVRGLPIVTDILANADFVEGVGNVMLTRLGTLDFAERLKPPIDQYLDANLGELVEAAMPETPEKAAARRVEEALRARVEGERADRKVAKQREREAAKLAEERAAKKATARTQRAALTSLPTAADPAAPTDAETAALAAHRSPVDLATVKRGSLLLDDGTQLSIDFSRAVAPSELQAMDGNSLLLKATAISIGAGMPEAFAIEAVMLVLECEQGHRVLRCPMQSRLLVGGGATAELGADSLLFRPI